MKNFAIKYVTKTGGESIFDRAIEELLEKYGKCHSSECLAQEAIDLIIKSESLHVAFYNFSVIKVPDHLVPRGGI